MITKKIQEENGQSYLDDKKRIREIRKARYRANIDEERKRSRNYRLTHAEKVRATNKRYRKNNLKKRREYDRQYRTSHIEKVREKQRLAAKKYRKKYPLANRKACKRYAKSHPEVIYQKSIRRRVREKSAIHEPWNSIDVLKRDNYTCGLCGQQIDIKLKYPHPMSRSIDHILPISKGGSDTAENLQAAHFICNVRKNNRVLRTA